MRFSSPRATLSGCFRWSRLIAIRPRRNNAKRPRPDFEAIDIRTADGWSLRADVHEPAEDACGVAVLAHAMMARRAEFDRPQGNGLARFMVARGWCVVAFDFR